MSRLFAPDGMIHVIAPVREKPTKSSVRRKYRVNAEYEIGYCLSCTQEKCNGCATRKLYKKKKETKE